MMNRVHHYTFMTYGPNTKAAGECSSNINDVFPFISEACWVKKDDQRHIGRAAHTLVYGDYLFRFIALCLILFRIPVF